MIVNDRDKDPTVVLPYLVGRPLAATEIYRAFGYSKSAYYKAAREGRLVSAGSLIRVAKHFGLNPVDLLVRFGMIRPEDVTAYTTTRCGCGGDVIAESHPASAKKLGDLHGDPSTPPV